MSLSSVTFLRSAEGNKIEFQMNEALLRCACECEREWVLVCA